MATSHFDLHIFCRRQDNAELLRKIENTKELIQALIEANPYRKDLHDVLQQSLRYLKKGKENEGDQGHYVR